MNFPLYLLIVCLVGCIMFLLGKYCGWILGFDDGFTAGEQHAADHADDPDISDIRWQLCADGKSHPSVPSISSIHPSEF